MACQEVGPKNITAMGDITVVARSTLRGRSTVRPDAITVDPDTITVDPDTITVDPDTIPATIPVTTTTTVAMTIATMTIATMTRRQSPKH